MGLRILTENSFLINGPCVFADAQPRSKGGNMHNGDSFDHLLRETQAKLHKRGKKL
jgi:hypothetical protein